MFSSGLIVFASAVLIMIKLPRRTLLRVLRYDLAIDIVVSVLVLLIHWGTFSGVMAATFAGLMTSLATSGAKRAFGYIAGGRYFPGIVTLKV